MTKCSRLRAWASTYAGSSHFCLTALSASTRFSCAAVRARSSARSARCEKYARSGTTDEMTRAARTSASTAARPVRGDRRVVEVEVVRGTVCSALEAREGAPAGVARGVVELLLDAEQLVVLGDALRAGRGTGLDLTAVGRDREVGDRRVLGLAG